MPPRLRIWLRHLRSLLHHKVMPSARHSAAEIRQGMLRARNTLSGQKPISLRAGQARFLLSPQGAVAERLWARTRAERGQFDLMSRLLKPNAVFIDAGAGAGLFSLAAASQHESVRVHALETREPEWEMLRENVALNGRENIRLWRAAPDGLARTLGDLIQNEAWNSVDLLCIRGSDHLMDVLRAVETLLRSPQAPLVLYESRSRDAFRAGYHPVEAMWRLLDCGYSIFVMDDQTGRASLRRRGHDFDAWVVAARPGHPAFPLLSGEDTPT